MHTLRTLARVSLRMVDASPPVVARLAGALVHVLLAELAAEPGRTVARQVMPLHQAQAAVLAGLAVAANWKICSCW